MSESSSAEAIFRIAFNIPDEEIRDEYLQQACGGNRDLFDRVAALLQVEQRRPDFLQPPGTVNSTCGRELMAECPGMIIGRYKLLQKIGEGGMGVVYMAEQREPVRRKVALKIIKPGMDTKEVVGRFEAERQALAMMDHPNIARVFDGGATESGRPYFVMERVSGLPITKYCDEAKLTAHERLDLFMLVCDAVQHAHQKGIIHRDLKPSNVLVTLHGETPVPKIIDFGVAKATSRELTEKTVFTGHGQILGTPAYMSPEQVAISGLDVDTRSDIYALGVLLYELLAGAPPFDKERLREAGFDEMRRVIREEEPPRPSTRVTIMGDAAETVSTHRKTEPGKLSRLLHGELDWIVMKAIEKDRVRRYETADAFVRDVRRYLNDEPVEACPPSLAYRFRKIAHRNKSVIATGLLVVAALVVGGAVATWQAVRATRANADLEQNRRELLDVLQASIDMRAPDRSRIGGLASPRRLTFGPDGHLYVCSADSNCILRYDGQTGAFLDDFVPSSSGGLDHPIGLTFGPDSNLYVTSAYNHSVLRYDSETGDFVDVFVEAESGGLNRPSDLVFGPDGNLYVTGNTGDVKRFDGRTGQFIDIFVTNNGRLEWTRGLYFGADGYLYVCDFAKDCVLRFDAQTGKFIDEFISNDREDLSGPCMYFYESTDEFYLVCFSSDSLLVYDKSGAFQRVIIPAGRGGLHQPAGIAFCPDGRMLVSNSRHDEILQFDARTGEFLGEFVAAKSSGPTGFEHFCRSMIHWHLAQRQEARREYKKGVQWMQKYQRDNETLKRQREKAAKLLGVAY